ncbi:Protein of uncharacterised function (DUF3046) [Dermatophilus congolensis]|uniref:Protein of uncharacterized function (DUF3046) n=1 Tax=Dermatophilus congolensis TaxID=1863 RepID=A0AA46H082_9MICO|nr:DUF3046 domain-containing protein [Dermatophilus congolensis]STD07721.1 Protein of uncharacterised function (DUF3046) [Dermatophilus congolensis]
MRLSEFWRLMDEEFGTARAQVLASHQSVTALGGGTPDELLESGVEPRRVWEALVEQMGVPPERRLGQVVPLQENRDKY